MRSPVNMKRPVRLAVVITLAVILYVSVPVLGAVWWAKRIESAAYSGKDLAQSGAKSLVGRDATGAASRFADASAQFSRAQRMLGPQWVARGLSVIPVVGRQYVAARTLVAIGLDGAAAGEQLAAVVQQAQQGGSAKESSTSLSTLLTAGPSHAKAALSLARDAANLAAGLDERGLMPKLAKPVHSIKTAFAQAAPLLSRGERLLALGQYLLSAKHRILLISQDSAELRPTGGFAGSFGIVDVGPSGVRLDSYKDVYTLPNPPGVVTPPRGAIMTRDFSFRDANWWIDFPTSARALLGFWRAYHQPHVDGVVAVDIVTAKALLAVFEPIHLAKYSETFTSENLFKRLLYLIEVKQDGLSTRKDVLVALVTALEQRVLHADTAHLSLSAAALMQSADEKHLQMYFSDSDAQAAVVGLEWSGALAPPPGTTDLLAVSNAMNRASKINIAMDKSAAYDVALMPDGSAATTVTLGYSNVGSFVLPPPEPGVFRDFLRVYRAKGTALRPTAARPPAGSGMAVEGGLPVVYRMFLVARGQHHRETVVTRVPRAWRTSGGRAAYSLFLVKQADLQDVPTTVTITPPAGWRVSSVRARTTATGAALKTTQLDGRARLETPLSSDVILDVGLERR